MVNQWRRKHFWHPSRGRADKESQRSMLLRDFLNGRYPNIDLIDIVSHVFEFACNYEGSKFIQLKLDEASDYRKCSIFNELKSNLLALMVDRFGNFIIQKFINIGNHEQRCEIVSMVQCNFMELGRHKYGCRVLQCAIERTTDNEKGFLLLQFAGPSIVQLAEDLHGNHVVQNCFGSQDVATQVI